MCPFATETDIGTALNQIDDKNGDNVLDVCTGIVVMGNAIDTQVCYDNICATTLPPKLIR